MGRRSGGLAMSFACGWLPLIETGFACDRLDFPVERCFDTNIACVRDVLRWSNLNILALLCMYYVLESDITDNLVAFLCSRILAHRPSVGSRAIARVDSCHMLSPLGCWRSLETTHTNTNAWSEMIIERQLIGQGVPGGSHCSYPFIDIHGHCNQFLLHH